MDYQQLKSDNRALNYEEIRRGATRLQSKPLAFWFDIFGPCNLECKHCTFQVRGRTSDQEVSEDLYTKVVRTLMPTAFVCNLGGTNYGEMTIAPKFHRFILDCLKHEVKINLTTNGTRMDDTWFDDLLDSLTIVGFSMEGMEEQFEMMRGFKWRFFLKHVSKLVEGRAAKGKSFRIEWRYCAHADNIHQLPDMIRLCKQLGVDRIQMMNLIPFVPAQKFKSLYYHRTTANRFFREAREVANELDFNINLPPEFDTGTFESPNLVQIGNIGNNGKSSCQSGGECARSFGADEMVNCYRPWQTCSINELGNVTPCCVYWRSMGNLTQNSFEAIWNGRKYRRLRASTNTKPDSICHSCRMPKFDSDRNTSATQLAMGLKDLVRSAVTLKRSQIQFKGCMDESYNPAHAEAN